MNPVEEYESEHGTGTRVPLPFPKIMTYSRGGHKTTVYMRNRKKGNILEHRTLDLGELIRPPSFVGFTDYEGVIKPEWLGFITTITDLESLTHIVTEEEYKRRVEKSRNAPSHAEFDSVLEMIKRENGDMKRFFEEAFGSNL